MGCPKFSSLHVRLQVLVWIAIIPLLLLIVSENINDRFRKEAEIRDEAVSLVNLAKGDLEQHISNTRALLLAASLTDVMQEGGPAAISAFLKDQHKHHPEYLNFGAVDLQGNVFASAVPLKKPVNASDLYYFQQTLKSQAFTVGEYQIGRITGLEVILFGQPVFDSMGRMKFLLFASMDIKWLNRLWENIKLLPDSTFTVTDRSGHILFRYPHAPDKWIGKNMAHVPIIKVMLAKEKDITEDVGLDNESRIYAFTTTGPQGSNIHMAVGVSEKAALKPINNMLVISLFALALVTALGLCLARFYSNRYIMKPINALRDVAERFSSGDYTSRINISDGENELIALGKVFDHMAETIETRTKDLRLFRELLDKSNDTIFIADTETGRILDVNERALTNMGYSREELLNMHVMDVDAVTTEYPFWKEHTEGVRKKGHVVFESTHKRKDGTTFPVELNVRHVAVDDHSYLIGIARDITERKQSDKVIQEQSKRIEAFFNHAITPMAFLDRDFNFIRVNKAYADAGKRDVSEFPGHNHFEYYPSDAKSIFEEVVRTKTAFQTFSRPFTFVDHPELGITYWDWTLVPLLDSNGEVEFLVLSLVDVTEQRKSEELIKNILESVDEGFIIIDPEYRIISANRAYCEQVKAPDCDIIGRHCYEVSHHLDKPCFMADEDCAPRHTFKTGVPHTTIHTHYDKEGNPVYVETKSFPMKDSSGKVYAVIETLNNITERRKLEEQLRHAQKMEAIGTLAGGIAHDFNNILNVIIGYGGLMQMRMRPDDPQLAQLKEILAAGDRAAQLTKGLLTFSRKQVMEIRTVDLNDIVEGFKKMLMRIIGEDIDLKIMLSDKDLTAKADIVQIEQVLMNLAVNARDAMPKGGGLTIETCRLKIDREFIKAHGYGEPGEYALITVSDTGAGMDEKTREKIFEPYFTTKEIGKGTGLGLAIVYGIVTQHNGYIHCYSEPGKGTTFRIYIPLIKSMAEKTEKEETLAPQGGTETILIAEDDASVRALIKLILEGFGYTVIEAVDGNDAVSKFKENKDKIKLLLSDLIMPGKNGKEAYEDIKAIRNDLRVIFISGYARDIIQRFGIEEDLEFISKPVLPTELLRKVREELDR